MEQWHACQLRGQGGKRTSVHRSGCLRRTTATSGNAIWRPLLRPCDRPRRDECQPESYQENREVHGVVALRQPDISRVARLPSGKPTDKARHESLFRYGGEFEVLI